MIDCITGNKKPSYVPCPCWLGLILSRDEGYIENHGISIPIPTLSSRIINTDPSDDDLHITKIMKKWIAKPYVVESYEFEEEDDEDVDEEGVDNE